MTLKDLLKQVGKTKNIQAIQAHIYYKEHQTPPLGLSLSTYP